MPRNVRNFWLELSVDGKSTRVETGPQSKDGGFSLTILMRDKGGIERALEVTGMASDDGTLSLYARVPPAVADKLYVPPNALDVAPTLTVRSRR